MQEGFQVTYTDQNKKGTAYFFSGGGFNCDPNSVESIIAGFSVVQKNLAERGENTVYWYQKDIDEAKNNGTLANFEKAFKDLGLKLDSLENNFVAQSDGSTITSSGQAKAIEAGPEVHTAITPFGGADKPKPDSER